MTNHFHLLVQVGKASLSNIMQFIMGRYAVYFNWKTNSEGHVFDNRYFRGLVLTDGYLGTAIRYIHGNPMKAGMVSRAIDWKWSSARQFYEGGRGLVDLDAVRALFGGNLPLDLHEPAHELPPEAYIAQKNVPFVHEDPPPGPDLAEVADEILKGTGFTVVTLRGTGRRPPLPRLRRTFAAAAADRGANGKAIGRFLNRSPGWVSQALNCAS